MAFGVANGISSLDAAVASQVPSRVPGLAAVTYEQGKPVARATAGFADISGGLHASVDAAGLWFSMTKIVTATAALMLVERGHLGLSDQVRTLLPEFPEASANDPQPQVRHLLSHSSGIGNPMPIRWIHRADQPAPDAREFALELLSGKRLKHRAGERAVYTNLGYIALGEVITAAAGVPYQDFVRTEILRPLQLKRTGFSLAELPAGDAVAGYQRRFSPMTPLFRLLLPRGTFAGSEDGWLRFAPFVVDGSAYGGLIGSTADAARFMSLHLTGGEVDGVRLLEPASVEAMQTVQARGRGIDVGFGWFRRGSGRASADYWEHLGGGGGFWNMMRIWPKRETGAVCMGNSTRYDHEVVAKAVR
jgi:CubicO group peptidase (beta-lactamase class C family)